MSQHQTFRVLLVDEEERVLAGLRRQLRAHRDRWSVQFVANGEEALQEMERHGADVIVTDASPRERSGVELLRLVRKRWPATVRIVLSGRTGCEAFLAEPGVVHQLLHKPCDSRELISAIERAHELASLLELEELRAVAAAVDDLPISAGVYKELMQALNDEEFDVRAIAAIVERDIGLTTRLLQLVNSAFFGLARKVMSVRDAITLVGSDALRTIALTSLAFNALESDQGGDDSIEELWRKSCELGAVAGRLATLSGAEGEAVERARLAGALSLVGRGALLRQFPERFAVAQASARSLGLMLHEAEAIEFGAGQQLIGGYALGVWAFDDDLIAAVTYQATPELCETLNRAHPLVFVHLARCCVSPSSLVERLDPSPLMLEQSGLSLDALNRKEMAA